MLLRVESPCKAWGNDIEPVGLVCGGEYNESLDENLVKSLSGRRSEATVWYHCVHLSHARKVP